MIPKERDIQLPSHELDKTVFRNEAIPENKLWVDLINLNLELHLKEQLCKL